MTGISLSDQLSNQANTISMIAIYVSIGSAFISILLAIRGRRQQKRLQQLGDRALLARADLSPTTCYIVNQNKEAFTLCIYRDTPGVMRHYGIYQLKQNHDIISEIPLVKGGISFYTKIACIDHALKHSQGSPYTIKYES